MKILGTLFRFLCALVVLLAIAVYLDGPLQASLVDYIKAFTPDHLLALCNIEGWPAIAAGAVLLLTLCCGLRMGWNIVYSIATLAFFAEAALLALGPELALPSAARGLGWEAMLREVALNYPVAALMVPALCIVGSLCTTAPVRIAFTSLISCALCYGCAELLSLALAQWQAMSEPFLPSALALVDAFPWLLAALPAVFFLQYCIFMAIFETFVKEKKEKAADKQKKEEKKEEQAQEPAKAESKPVTAAAATVSVAVTPVVKRPVIHKKSPIAPAPAAKKDEPKAEDKKDEAPAAEAKQPEPATESGKTEEAEKPAAPAEAPKEDKPTKEDEPAKEADEAAPTVIPSVPLPPKPNEAS